MDMRQIRRLKKKRTRLDARQAKARLSLLDRLDLWPIESKQEGKAIREELDRKFSLLRYPPAKPWNPETPLDPLTLIDAATYPLSPIFNLPPARFEDITDKDKYLVSPSGCFGYQNREVAAYQPLQVHSGKAVAFTAPVALPLLIDMERAGRTGMEFGSSVTVAKRIRYGNVWMSLSPNECISQWPGIVRAKGKVVVGGLGLGWFLKMISAKEDVESIVVVERSRELLDWYGYTLCGSIPKVTDVVCDDVYQQLGKHGDDAVYLLDIWPTQSCVNTDQQFLKAKAELGDRLWGWGWNGTDE